jgi:hypothetical protein
MRNVYNILPRMLQEKTLLGKTGADGMVSLKYSRNGCQGAEAAIAKLLSMVMNHTEVYRASIYLTTISCHFLLAS